MLIANVSASQKGKGIGLQLVVLHPQENSKIFFFSSPENIYDIFPLLHAHVIWLNSADLAQQEAQWHSY